MVTWRDARTSAREGGARSELTVAGAGFHLRWGSFGDDGCLRPDFDEWLGCSSLVAPFQAERFLIRLLKRSWGGAQDANEATHI